MEPIIYLIVATILGTVAVCLLIWALSKVPSDVVFTCSGIFIALIIGAFVGTLVFDFFGVYNFYSEF